ncbi:MAG: helix-turn-helix domain-containing protein [Ruminococcus sp.]|jgi:transcriptional regulator with XRE-family HTH domain|nr:helix-turn-helix domain-containing protein [Ruminococcus sp.]
MDATEKIKQLLAQRGWTAYRLSKNSGLAESTITNILKRNTVPSIPTLEAICKGFGITISQFFADGEMIEITPDISELIQYYTVLSPDQKVIAIQLLKNMNHK